MEQVVADIVRADVEPDGLEFEEGSIRGEEIREDQEYRGVRVRLTAHLAGARIPLQVDVAFGDVVTPAPEPLEYPTMLDLPAPRLRAYPPEPVVAEKFQAMVALGMANSRMKDFYDVWALAERMRFEGRRLRRALEATFRRRRTPVPADAPVALTAEFHDDGSKRVQWPPSSAGADSRRPISPRSSTASERSSSLLRHPSHEETRSTLSGHRPGRGDHARDACASGPLEPGEGRPERAADGDGNGDPHGRRRRQGLGGRAAGLLATADGGQTWTKLTP